MELTLKSKKDLFLQRLRDTYNGNITLTCKDVGISRGTYYKWCLNKLFKVEVDAINDARLDEVEASLFNSAVRDNNPQAQIFIMRTKGKHRGYVEKQITENIIKTNPYENVVVEVIYNKNNNDDNKDD